MGEFAKLLRADEQLVDVYTYRTFQGRPAYAAFFLTPDGSVSTSRLGDAAQSGAALALWRQRVVAGGTAEAQWREINHSIGTLLSSRISGATTRVFVSPDGDLTRLPLSLLDSLNGVVVAQLDSPRELAYLRANNSESEASVIARVQGGVDDETKNKPLSGKELLCIGDLYFGRSTEGLVFPALPGTRKELSSIAGLALKAGWKVRLITGSDARKQRVIAAIPTADYVHFATHGFFLRGGFSNELQELKLASPAEQNSTPSQLARSPLAESGLVLSCPDDGSSKTPELLTAEEIVGLNPGRCKSIVLSACETGLGTTESGQGVLGLRASFIAAGMRRLVMSLWKVPDQSSTLLMEKFYENLLVSGQPPAVALKNAQNGVRSAAHGAFQAPAHWMGWVLVGEGW